MMKRKYNIVFGWFLAILLFSLPESLISQTGWYPLQSGTSQVLKSIYFVDSHIGYMSGDDILLKSTNSGNNWLVINDEMGGRAIQFIDANTGYVCDGTIYKTTNGGVSWSNMNLTSLNGMYFLNEQIGYAAGKNNQIVKTTNGGVSWQVQSSGGFYNKFNAVCFLSENIGFAVGGKSVFPYYGVVYKTTNGGSVWNQVFSDAQDIEFRGIDFVNGTTGYLVGGNEHESNGVIYKTTNAGET